MTRINRNLRHIIPILIFSLILCMTAWAAEEYEDRVITGKDGWYFYENNESLKDFQGTDLFTEDELADIRLRVERLKEICDDRGIELIILLAPNKEHLYPEYMPDEYGSPASRTRLEQLCDYLGDEFCVVSAFQNLSAAKESRPEYCYYYKTDSHWNALGAYIGAQDLMTAAGCPLPDLFTLEIEEQICPGKELARALDIELSAPDIEYTINGYGTFSTEEIESDDEKNYIRYYTDGAPSRSITIFGDSFSIGMAPYIGQNFENIYLHRTVNATSSMIDEEQPSVVVYELLERNLDYMKLFGITGR